jgi:hypothetical protein
MSHSPLSARQRADVETATAVENAHNPLVKAAVAYWQSQCAQRRFPARDTLTLRGVAPFLPYSVIVGVVDGGADYEYRFVGEAQRQAFGVYFKGLRLSQIETAAPELGAILRSAYEQVRSTGVPFLVRGQVDHEPARSQFRYHESAFLPLGVSDAAVDHLLIVGVQVPTPFWALRDEKLKILANQITAATASAF